MLTLIAQTMTPPPGTAEWLAVAFFLIGGIYAAVKLFQSFRPQPPNDERYASRGELSQLRAEFEDFRNEQRISNRQLLDAGEERAIKLHDRINLLLDGVGELRGQIKFLAKKS